MRIAAFHFRKFSLLFRTPFRTARQTLVRREGYALAVVDGDGMWGYGEAAPLAGFGMESLAQTERVLDSWRRTLPGRQVEDGRGPLTDPQPAFGLDDGADDSPAARHGLELALLDLLASRNGLSLAEMLAPEPAGSVAVNATLGALHPEQARRQAARLARRGFGTIKVKVGTGDDEADVARLKAVREAVGSAVKIRIDANGAWKTEHALRMVERMAPLHPEFLEQPVPPGDLQAMATVARAANFPIAADEAVLSAEDARRVIDAGAASILILKPMALGGLISALAVAQVAARHGVATVFTTTLDGVIARLGALHATAAAHAGHESAATELANGLATGELLQEDLCADPAAPHEGRMTLPPGPGLGLPQADVRPGGRDEVRNFFLSAD